MVSPDISVKLSNKLTLQPSEKGYVLAHYPNSIEDPNFVFEPKFNCGAVTTFPSLYSTKDLVTSKPNFSSFYIFVQNSSEETLHINKGSKIGTISSISADDTTNFPNFDSTPNNNDILPNDFSSHNVNVIVASQHVLDQRKAELLPTDFNLSHLASNDQDVLLSLLMSNYACFSKSLTTLGHTDRVKPHVSLVHDYPIKTLPFPVPQSLQSTALSQLEEMMAANIIERANTEWACPMLLVRKKQSNDYRLALDLRLLNSVLKSSSYPLPKINDIISNLSSYKYFTVLDFPNAYWQVDLPPHLQDIVAFTTPFGAYKSKRLVFGLKTAASTFQSLVDSLLDEIHLPGIFAYQDDFIICSNNLQETISKLTTVFSVFSKNNVTLSPNKCSFHKSSINFLGFHVQQKTITPIESNIVKITSFPQPKTKRQLKRFIGICGYYRNLIPCYAKLMQPLIDISTPKAIFKWDDVHESSFSQLQSIFFKHPFVKLPNWEQPFYLNTDASINGISGILLQKSNDNFHPISYFSKSLKQSEKRYPALKLELYALFRSVLAFKHYLFNREFFVMTDSKPLMKYNHTVSPTDVATRWLMTLSEYSITYIHVPGKENVLADFFSRLEKDPPCQNLKTNPELLTSPEVLPIVSHVFTTTSTSINNNSTSDDPHLDISVQTFLVEQQKDSDLNNIRNLLASHSKLDKHQRFYFLHPQTKLLCWDNHNPRKPDRHNIIVVPNSLKSKVLSMMHVTHLGVNKTYLLLKDRYHWRGMYADTVNFINSCTSCIRHKPHVVPPAPFPDKPLPSAPNQLISSDILGPLSNGHYVLTIIDHFTRHIQLYPLLHITADAVTDCLFTYVCTFGKPSAILTDLGTQFTSYVMQKLTSTLGISLHHTASGNPQANALSERINTSIKTSINTLLESNVSFRHALLIHSNLYNGSLHSSTDFSPNLVHFGRELSLIFDTFDHDVELEQLDKSRFLDNLINTLKHVYNKVSSNLKDKQVLQSTKQLSKAKLRSLKIGDVVYLKSINPFKRKYNGPFEVIKVHSAVIYSIRTLNNPSASSMKIHINRLLLAPPRNSNLQYSRPSSVRNTTSTNDQRRFQTRYFLRSRP